MNGNEACKTGSQLAASVHVGIDVSKLKLDAARLRAGKVRNKFFSNDRAGFKALAAWLSEDDVTPAWAHLCLEGHRPLQRSTGSLAQR